MLTAFKDRFLEQQAFNAGVSWVLSKTEDVSTVVDFARSCCKPTRHGRFRTPRETAIHTARPRPREKIHAPKIQKIKVSRSANPTGNQ